MGAEAATKTYLGLRGTKLNHAITVVAGCGFLLFGYDQGVMGTLLTFDSFMTQFPNLKTDTLHNSIIQGTVISIYEIGCMIGALTTMWSGDKFGRRKNIFCGSAIMIVGAILQSSSFSIGQLVVGRVVTGLGNGFITATIPMFQSECAKPEERGKLVIISGSLITGGICFSYWVDYGFSFLETSDVNWRFPVALQIVFALIVMPLIMKLPESPRWLVRTGHIDEARNVFAALLDAENDHTEEVQRQLDEVCATLIEEDMSHNAVKRIFSQGKAKNFHRTCLAYFNQCFQQISGINLITYYAGTIYQNSLGMDPPMARLLAALNGTEYFMASWIPYWTIERFGRRTLMLFGAAGMSASMAILTATVWDGVSRGNDSSSIAAAVFLFVFNSFFAIGWLGMTWLYPAEIVSLEIRAPANAISTASNWIHNFLIVMITPIAFYNIKHFTYTIFAVINALMFVAVYFFFPETSGRSLEEIDEIFERGNVYTPWDVVGIANNLPKRGHMDIETIQARHGYARHNEDFPKGEIEHAQSSSNSADVL